MLLEPLSRPGEDDHAHGSRRQEDHGGPASSAQGIPSAERISAKQLAAEANEVDDQFIAALNKAGVHYGEPANAVALGQSICPMLAKPGGTFAAAVAKVQGGGISAGMASMFAQIAIEMYCPQVMADVAGGNLSGLPKVPGVPGI